MIIDYKIDTSSFVVENSDGFQITKLFRDEISPKNSRLLLEIYFNDVYKLLLKRLSMIEGESNVTEEDLGKLESVFSEFKKVKKMLIDLPSTNKNSN